MQHQLWVWIDENYRAHFFGVQTEEVVERATALGLNRYKLTERQFLNLEKAVLEDGVRYPKVADYGVLLLQP